METAASQRRWEPFHRRPPVSEAMTCVRPPRLWRIGVIPSFALMLTACEDPSASDALTRPPAVESVRLVPLPDSLGGKCLRIEVLAPLCLAEVPATETRYRVRELDYGTDLYRVVEFAANAPYPNIDRRNAPPRFAHVVVKGGDLTKAFYFEWPSGPLVPVADALEGDRQIPVLLEAPSWAGEQAALLLAPAFPAGGVDGDHLVYRWEEGGREYALSLHAWKPFDECMATLRVLVESIA
jgi:hypothetical protein